MQTYLENVALNGKSSKACYAYAETLMGLVGQKPANYKKAFDLYQKCADLGDQIGLYWTGVLYAKGNGTEKNLDKAIEYLTKASEAGNTHAD